MTREEAQLRKLTDEQLQQLQGMIPAGPNHSREVLWQILYEYLKMRGATNFKAKWFNKDREKHRKTKHSLMIDCPLCGGKLINAIKYGSENGMFYSVGCKNNLRWFLKDQEGQDDIEV